MKDPVDQGCRSALFATTSEDVVGQGIDGQYIVPDRKVTDVSKKASDEELQERCWRLTESVLREKVGELGYEMS
jgi:WW domain-containing oxidoreductase